MYYKFQRRVVLLGIGILLCLQLICVTFLSAQEKEKLVLAHGKHCSFSDGVASDTVEIFLELSTEPVQKALSRIMQEMSLTSRNMELRAGLVNDAQASMYEVNGEWRRVIIYNKYLFDAMYRLLPDSTSADWLSIGVLAHEIGHHVLGHVLSSEGSRQEVELEADRFSGSTMFKMGATLEQVVLAAEKLAPVNSTGVYPSRSERIEAFKKGWFEARDKDSDRPKPSNSNKSQSSLGNDGIIVIKSSADAFEESWLVVARQPSNMSQWRIFLDDESLKSKTLDSLWGHRYNYWITSVGDGDERWVFILSKTDTAFAHQTYWFTREWPTTWVQKKYDSGMVITSMAYGNDRWLVVMSKLKASASQAYQRDSVFPEDWIRTKWKKGQHITCMDYGDGLWTIVMTGNTGIIQQQYVISENFPDEWVQTMHKQGWYLSSAGLEYDDEGSHQRWIVVVSRGIKEAATQFVSDNAFPLEWIQEYWAGDYHISFVY